MSARLISPSEAYPHRKETRRFDVCNHRLHKLFHVDDQRVPPACDLIHRICPLYIKNIRKLWRQGCLDATASLIFYRLHRREQQDIESRVFISIITHRSMPIPKPPVGGMPYSGADESSSIMQASSSPAPQLCGAGSALLVDGIVELRKKRCPSRCGR